MEITASEANLELALLEARAKEYRGVDFEARFTNAGLPPEIVFRLRELWDYSCVVAGKVTHIGKIIIMEIARFVDENPHLAIGAALGAAVGSLVSLVPFLGPILAPLSTAIGAFVGAIGGAHLDKGEKLSNGAMGIAQEIIIVSKKFFELLAAIFNALKSEIVSTQ